MLQQCINFVYMSSYYWKLINTEAYTEASKVIAGMHTILVTVDKISVWVCFNNRWDN